MIERLLSAIGESAATGLIRAVATALDSDGRVQVQVVDRDGNDDPSIWCTVLETSSADRLRVDVGDTLLVWLAADDSAVILGRIERAAREQAEEATEDDAVPAVLVVEAKEAITFRVGEGSITMRGDGKILIKGTDLVSHAKRMNRIKGGAVSIN
jgi:hypothetical protein